jgi:hypothetical protein
VNPSWTTRIASAAAVGITLATVTAGVTAAAHAASSPGWRVSAVLQKPGFSDLLALTAAGPNDAWAFGNISKSARPTAVHWNGKSWSISLLPGGSSRPDSASSTSPTNVWAAGSTCPGGSSPQSSYVSRWNGKKWTTSTFNRDFCNPALVTTGPKNGWLFGRSPNAVDAAQTLHFDGTNWRTVQLGKVGSVMSASASSAKDVWAFTIRRNLKTLAMHWDGRAWQSVPLPKFDLSKGKYLYPNTIYAVSPTQAWATGGVYDPATSQHYAVLLHWNGKTWQRVAAPGNEDLGELTSDGSGGVWAIGNPVNAAQNAYSFVHYTHGTWTSELATVNGIPNAVSSSATIDVFNIALIPGTHSVWATGDVFYYDQNNIFHQKTLIYKYGP